MNIFISWSGNRSHHIATALKEWLPNVIQTLDPFLSTRDIKKGKRGNIEIQENLENANFGIICLTPENTKSKWILFESGALSKLSSAYVCTYLFQMSPGEVEPPLGQFQHTKADENDTRQLVETINDALPSENQLHPERLRKSFDMWWPRLDTEINATPPPDTALPDKRSEQSKLDEILEVVRSIKSTNVKPKTDHSPEIKRRLRAIWLKRLSERAVDISNIQIGGDVWNILHELNRRGLVDFQKTQTQNLAVLSAAGIEQAKNFKAIWNGTIN